MIDICVSEHDDPIKSELQSIQAMFHQIHPITNKTMIFPNTPITPKNIG